MTDNETGEMAHQPTLKISEIVYSDLSGMPTRWTDFGHAPPNDVLEACRLLLRRWEGAR